MKHARSLIAVCLLLAALIVVWRWNARHTGHAPHAQEETARPAATAPGKSAMAGATAQADAAAGKSAEGGAVSPWKLTGKVADVTPRRHAKGPTMAIDITAARNTWEHLKKGDLLDIDLGEGGQVRARVNLVAETNGATRIEGSLLEQERGSFALRLKNAALSGMLLLPEKSLAYIVSTRAGNLSDIQAVPLGSVICHALPPPPDRDMVLSVPTSADERSIPQLESRPGAGTVLFLNFNGTPGVYPYWNEGNPIDVQPSTLSEEGIVYVWKSVSEDYWPFRVNITTIRERYESAPKNKRMECIITPTDTAAPGAGGVAYLYSFYWDGNGDDKHFGEDTCCWVFNSGKASIAEAVSHELGHTFGLSHDGAGGDKPDENSYYWGHEDESWGPIMGASYDMNVVQWSKGEYEGANNQEDDIAIIATGAGAYVPPGGVAPERVVGLGFTADGIGGGRFDATTIPLTSGSTFSQSAVLLGDTDVNMHRLTLPGAAGSSYYTVAIHTKPAAVAPNAKLSFEVQPFFYGLPAIATAGDPESPEMDARIESLTLEGGSSYYLQVRGIGYAGSGSSAAASGFTAYGSAGEYTLEGTFIAYTKPVELQRLPVTTDGVLGFDVTLVAVVNGYPKAQVTWEMSPDGGTTWILLGNGEISPHGGTYAISEDGARLVISGLTTDMNAYQYRCIATNVIDRVGYSASSVTTLRVVESLVPSPVSLARDSTGTLYVADDKLHAIRTIVPATSGTFHVGSYAGETEVPGLANGAGGEARFNSPGGIAITPARDLYVADTGNHQIRLVTHAGTLAPSVTTFAGSPASGLADGDAAATAQFTSPGDVAVVSGTIYVADTLNHAIRVIVGGTVTTLFGAAGEAGWADGDAADARLNQPSGIAVTDSGEIYVADTGNHVIRKIDSGTLATIAGLPGEATFSDGAGYDAHFNRPMGLAFQSGTLYVADCENSAIRMVFTNSAGNYEAGTLAGDPLEPTRTDGTAAQARFKYPQDIIAGVDGHLYVADTGNAAIRKIEPDHQNRVSTLELKQQPPPEPPQPPTAGGNGSAEQSSTGGGAPSPWLLLAFAALAGLRFVRPRR
jgi:sugar lactone lactonase YvrE